MSLCYLGNSLLFGFFVTKLQGSINFGLPKFVAFIVLFTFFATGVCCTIPSLLLPSYFYGPCSCMLPNSCYFPSCHSCSCRRLSKAANREGSQKGELNYDEGLGEVPKLSVCLCVRLLHLCPSPSPSPSLKAGYRGRSRRKGCLCVRVAGDSPRGQSSFIPEYSFASMWRKKLELC